ncbi:MAG: STAS domain-containing protein [Desulfomonilaceae bacterium]
MKVEKRGGITILVTEERLDSLDGPKLRDVVKQMVQESSFNIVIDMEKTLFLDSSGCGGLLSSLKTLTNNHGDMKIARPTSKVLEVFQLTRLHRVFEIHNTLESAVNSFTR